MLPEVLFSKSRFSIHCFLYKIWLFSVQTILVPWWAYRSLRAPTLPRQQAPIIPKWVTQHGALPLQLGQKFTGGIAQPDNVSNNIASASSTRLFLFTFEFCRQAGNSSSGWSIGNFESMRFLYQLFGNHKIFQNIPRISNDLHAEGRRALSAFWDWGSGC